MKIYVNTLLSLAIVGGIFTSAYANNTLADLKIAIVEQDYTKAQKISKQLLSSDLDKTTAVEVNYYMGLSALNLKEYNQAREYFSKLLKQKINIELRDKSYLGTFDAYYLQGQYKDARLIARRLLKASPQSEFLSSLYLKLARANLKLAKWNVARNYLEKIIQYFPDSFEVHSAKQLLDEKQYFAVQVGAFLERERAEELAHSLRQGNEYAYIVETNDRSNQKFYRVRVGQLAKLKEAQTLKSNLSKQGYPTQIYP